MWAILVIQIETRIRGRERKKNLQRQCCTVNSRQTLLWLQVFPFFCLCLPFWFRNNFAYSCILLSGLRRDWCMEICRVGGWEVSPPYSSLNQLFFPAFKKTQHPWFRNQKNICYVMCLLASRRGRKRTETEFGMNIVINAKWQRGETFH
jgi:hypothetical protein